MKNSFCAQGISCKRKISCQWDFLVQIKSNQIRVVADRARYKPSIHSLYMCSYWGCMHMYMWLWTKPGPMRETHDALGVCTSLTAHNVPRWSRERQCVRNLSGGGIVSCIFVSLSTVCSHENLTEFWFFIPSLPVSDSHDSPSSQAWWGSGCKLGNKHGNKQTGWATAWRAALMTLQRWISPSAQWLGHKHTHVVNQHVSLCMID